MKLIVVRENGNIRRYMLAINKNEAEAAGFLGEDGMPVEIDKVVNPDAGQIIIKKSTSVPKKAISSRFIYKHLDILLSGQRARTARNDHYIMKENILYKQDHQSYLRDEEPIPYASFVNGVFYEV